VVEGRHRIVVTEGTYLLHDRPPWDGLAGLFDHTVFASAPEAVLRERLVRRWLDHGLDPAAAEARAAGNDLANARVVQGSRRMADDDWIA
jgi:fructokinase